MACFCNAYGSPVAFWGVLNRPEGATNAGGDGALNLALYLPDANPPSDPT